MAKLKVVIVAKRTAIDRFIEEGRDPRIARLIRRSDPSVRRWRRAHDDHERSLEGVQKALDRLGAATWLVRGAEGAFDARGIALVVSVGGDGTLISASHNVTNTPVLGVNSSPDHSIGFFCAARRSNLDELLARALSQDLESVRLSRMRVELNGRTISTRVLNEALFCHSSPAATSRYIIRCGRLQEEQRSSGLWIGTAAGSTGALHAAGGKVLPLTSRALQLVVREPYQPGGERYRLIRVVASEKQKVTVHNKMQEACVFLDGPFRQIPVAIGETLAFSESPEPLTVLGLSRSRSRPPARGKKRH